MQADHEPVGLGRRARSIEEMGVNMMALAAIPPTRFRPIEPQPGEALVTEVEGMTSREFMYAHKDRFDDAMVCAALEAKLGIPADSDSTKVQQRGSDAAKIPPAISAQIDEIWAERVAPTTGHVDFASLAAEVERQQAHATTA